MFEVTTDRSANLKKAINRLSALLVVLSIPIATLVIQSCGDEDDIGQGSGIAEGFRAEVYRNGELSADEFTVGIATLVNPQTDAYIDIQGSSGGYTIHIKFSSKNLGGIDEYPTGALDTTNYSEPFFQLIDYGEYIVSNYIYSNSNKLGGLGGPGETVGTASGEIIMINRERVAGKFNAKDKNNAWEVRNCEFNVEVTGGS